MMVGAIAVPVNIHYKLPELVSLMRRLRAVAYFGHRAQRKVMDEIAADLLPFARRFYLDGTPNDESANRDDHASDTWQALISAASEAQQFPDANPDATAVLLCTSGTTGEPKLVAHSQRSLAQTSRYMRDAGFDRSVRPLLPTPLFHMPGTGWLCGTLSAGGCVVMPLCADFDGAAFLDAIEQHCCTNIAVTPYGAAEMIRAQSVRRRSTASLRICVVAGDACSIELQQRFEQTFDMPLPCRFGMTEAMYGVVPGRTTRTMRARPQTVRLVDSEGNDVTIGVRKLSRPCCRTRQPPMPLWSACRTKHSANALLAL
jgi:acyl-CoA synthetase (AMP-forming)/AMP-acid ligase II